MPDIENMTAAELRKHDEMMADANEKIAARAADLIPMHGGGDPDSMNRRRIAWGRSIAAHCHELTGADLEDAVSDAIAYLLHAAPAWGETAEQALSRAVQHFNEETTPDPID